MEKYYKILNLNTNASKEDIRNAYKKLALLFKYMKKIKDACINDTSLHQWTC